MANRKTSSVILITLAELAWLAAFGLLFAYRGKVGELGVLQQRVESIETGSKDVPKLIDERDRARTEMITLQGRLKGFEQYLNGRSAAEVDRLLTAAADSEKKLEETRRRLEKALAEVAKQRDTAEDLKSQLAATNKVLTDLQNKWDVLPSNAAELGRLYQDASNHLGQTRINLELARSEAVGLSNRLGQLERGEVAIRRELIGLPSAELQRVIFIVDTSSSMRNSPAWNDARSLMRMWLEYLSVEECSLVNFNDKAVVFPTSGYQRVREKGGESLAAKKADLMAAFDKADGGIYSDLLAGLRLAYSRPSPNLIVLFTDGHPHVATKGDSGYGRAILAEVAKHPGIPILTVAVGSYEVEGVGGPNERRNAAIDFLKKLGKQSGGNFIGR